MNFNVFAKLTLPVAFAIEIVERAVIYPGMDLTPEALAVRLNDDADELTIEFEDGRSFELSAEYLRINSPSAEVRGHRPEEARLQSGKRGVKIRRVDPVGDYALALRFDDGHSSGIYTWEWLYTLGAEFDVRWRRYLQQLEDAGASRAP